MLRNLAMLAIALLLIHPGWGQAGTTGTILGTVTDSTGAVIPGATVEITNVATNVITRVTTTATGDYTVPNLIPGNYKVSGQMSGFSKAVVNGIVLVVAQNARVDLHLKTGTASETIEVNATAVALDTDTSAIAQTVTPQQVSELPLNGRNFTDLLFIGAGAVQTVGEQGQMRQSEGDAISIDGGRPESNNYTLDGLNNTDTALNTPAVILSQDAIQEFKVQSETYSAQYGFSANQINMVSKSGTNQLHGSVFEFDRNDAFDAIPHQTLTNTSTTNVELRQNQFGYVLGGPAIIPKLYDGRNKTFWLANYEGWRIIQGGHLSGYAPTSAELGGNFSGVALPAYGTAACTANLAASLNCMPVDPLTGAPFPSDTIPSSRFSRLAQVTSKLIPTSQTGADPNGVGAYNWFATANATTDTDQQTYRGDQDFQKYGHIFFRYTKADYANTSWGTDALADSAGANIFTENSTSWTGAYTLTLPKGFVNDFRFGKLEAQAIQGDSAATASDISALGLTGVFTSLPAYAAGYPTLGFGVPNAVSAGSPGNDPTTSDIPVWEFADSVAKQFRSHSFSFGFDLRSWVQKRNLATNFLGSFGYLSNLITLNGPGCATPTCGTGNSYADFLLGYYDSAATFQPGPFTYGSQPGHLDQYVFRYVAPYFQDDWKVSPKLTLNLGLRWDFREIPYADDKGATFGTDQLFWLDPQNTLGGLCFGDKDLLTDGIAPAGNGFYRYCGQKPKSSSFTPFAPRLGFAYRPMNKLVVRGGYGIFFDSSETREMDNSGDQYPFLIRTSVTPYVGGPPKTTDGLFVPMSTPTPVSAAANGGAFTAVIISENPMNPYVQQWTLSVERELSHDTTVEVNYVGNKGTHLLERFNVDQAGALPAADVAPCNANPADATHDCPYTSRLPLPNFTSSNGFLDSKWIGYSSYNAGNVKLEHRASDGAVLVVYTWAKSMDSKSAAAGIGSTNSYAGPMDSADPRLDYGRSDFNVGQRFVASYAYMLPVGRGKRFGGSMNRAADAAVGGWEWTGIATFQQGFPFSVLANDVDGLLMTPIQRADVTGNPNSGFHKSVGEWFNTAAFSQPPAGVFGTAGRNSLTGPGISNWDMGLVKYFSITERAKLQLRAETFNTFNHTQWGVDPTTLGASGPGTSDVVTNVNAGNFGAVQYARPPRIIQFGGKVTF
jgi:Carboxypeptidase regulatory-like domain